MPANITAAAQLLLNSVLDLAGTVSWPLLPLSYMHDLITMLLNAVHQTSLWGCIQQRFQRDTTRPHTVCWLGPGMGGGGLVATLLATLLACKNHCCCAAAARSVDGPGRYTFQAHELPLHAAIMIAD